MPQLIVIGVILGSIIALGALGLTLLYGILKFAHFAHGDMMTVGAYVAFLALIPGGQIGALSFGWGFLFALAVSMVAVAGIAVGIDRAVYRPLRRRGSGFVVMAIASLGVAIVLRAVILFIWGPQQEFYVKGIHPAIQFPLDIAVKADQFFIVGTGAVLLAAVWYLLYATRMGKAMRAMADNPELARVSGIDTDRVIVWTWVIGGGLTAVAGVLLALQSHVKPEIGFAFLLPLFAATILGGIGSPVGAVVGAMVVGIAQQVSTYWIEPGFKPAIAFLILILMLLVRPRGLFGAKV